MKVSACKFMLWELIMNSVHGLDLKQIFWPLLHYYIWLNIETCDLKILIILSNK